MERDPAPGCAHKQALAWLQGQQEALPGGVSERAAPPCSAAHSRWSAYNALPPLCDVHVEMPLP